MFDDGLIIEAANAIGDSNISKESSHAAYSALHNNIRLIKFFVFFQLYDPHY